jgi:DNA-binding response OmpR family regulator
VKDRWKESAVTALVFLIDDDTVLFRELQPALVREGFCVEHALPSLDAIRRMLADEPDLVILGIDSGETSWEFCRRLLTFLDKPLLLLLSTTNRLDRVKGLELGADDCMIKPVLTVEVIARARALLRRSEFQAARSKRSHFVDKELEVDLTRRQVWLDGEPVALTPTEFRFLCCFIQHVGEILPHERLRIQVWGPSYTDARNSIKQYVHQLRQKLEPNPSHPQRILTRRGEGYLFQSLADTRVGTRP